jgi:AcrR family transcriptional regulator
MDKKRTRGRPRKFDKDEALDSALHEFWHVGFGESTLDGLGKAMGLNKPSIYASFGNKEALYTAALDRYMETYGQRYFEALNATGDLRRDLTAHFAIFLDTVTSESGPGCPVACTLPAETQNSERIKAKLAEFLKRVDDGTVNRIKAAQHDSQLRENLDARTVAQMIVSMMLSFSIRARAGASRRELNRLANALVNMICAH